jgi:hypothetical protein
MTFLAGYPFRDVVTQNLGDRSVGCERSHPGATAEAGVFRVSGSDYTGGDPVFAGMLDSDNRPERLKQHQIITSSGETTCLPARPSREMP